MINKEILINNLFRKFEKEKWQIKDILLALNQVLLTTKKGKHKITMIIKLEEDV